MSRLRILYICDNFPPEFNAGASRTFEMAKIWRNKHDVRVVTCAPNFPRGELFPGYKNRIFQKEQIEGIEVIRVWSFIQPNSGTILRILDFVSFGLSAFLAGLFLKYDVVITSSPQFFVGFSGFFLKYLKRRPWIFEVRDLWPDSALAVGAVKKKGKVFQFFKFWEHLFYKSCNGLVLATQSFVKEVRKECDVQIDKIEVVYNGANLELFRPQQINRNRKRYAFEILYLGTIGQAHSLEKVVHFKRPPGVFLTIVGEGAKRNELEKLEIDGVNVHPAVLKTETPRILAQCDMTLVHLKRTPMFKNVIPSKIFESCAMQRPVLLGVEGEAKELVDHYGVGECFTPEDSRSFYSAVERLVTNLKSDPDYYREKCSSFAELFSREKQALVFSKFIEEKVCANSFKLAKRGY